MWSADRVALVLGCGAAAGLILLCLLLLCILYGSLEGRAKRRRPNVVGDMEMPPLRRSPSSPPPRQAGAGRHVQGRHGRPPHHHPRRRRPEAPRLRHVQVRGGAFELSIGGWDCPSRKRRVEEFRRSVVAMHKDADFAFQSEFEVRPPPSPKCQHLAISSAHFEQLDEQSRSLPLDRSALAAMQGSNAAKNRFLDILPCILPPFPIPISF